MKTSALLSAASVAAVAAVVLTATSFEAAISVLCAAGFLAIAIRDYAYTPRFRPAAPALLLAGTPRGERLGLAA
ncbi:MAG: hypothetical protein NTV51_25480 [Verrucomicrobia bacterium]|nr:hypothetical protein [Verrucomicrobiota bacterium]